jgi:hypothetical protein|tara:strand:+ start:141317 stop:141754 length:438 start_codon:yes stop_codon:yes gene_type:complete
VKKKEKPVIGWREWMSLPSLHIKKIKVKVDTGARTSSLHAFDLKYTTRKGEDYVSFKVHPIQKDSKTTVECKAKVLEYRKVKSSNGHTEQRPVIIVEAKLHDQKWPIEVTLTNRDEMGFRMLLGRAAMKGHFIVDPGKSYYSKKL